jgi:hypothetical protein
MIEEIINSKGHVKRHYPANGPFPARTIHQFDGISVKITHDGDRVFKVFKLGREIGKINEFCFVMALELRELK